MKSFSLNKIHTDETGSSLMTPILPMIKLISCSKKASLFEQHLLTWGGKGIFCWVGSLPSGTHQVKVKNKNKRKEKKTKGTGESASDVSVFSEKEKENEERKRVTIKGVQDQSLSTNLPRPETSFGGSRF